MIAIRPMPSAHAEAKRTARGFGLLEVMIALALGLLLSLGIITVFGATSSTSRVQEALARLQENGRYASTRMSADLRMLGGQYCESASSADASAPPAASTATSNGVVYPIHAINSWAPGAGAAALGTTNNALPDGNGVAGAMPGNADLTKAPYPLSPAISAQGYDCALGTACINVPSGASNPADGLPTVGTNAGDRVGGADVLTIRYQSGSGWQYTPTGSGNGTVLTLRPSASDDDVTAKDYKFDPGDRALVTKCASGQIFQVAVAGTAAAPALSPDPNVAIANTFRVDDTTIGRGTTFDARVFNFTKNFVTVTYYLRYQADASTPGRVVPTLMRKVNGGGPGPGDEVVQGVERLDFLYGVQYKDGSFRYLNATQVDANSNAANCLLPAAVTDTAGCLWGMVRSVQVNLLLDSVNNLPLGDAETEFRYSVDGGATCTPPASPTADMTYCTAAGTATNGSKAGRMMRREFISMVNVRNGNR